MDKQSIKFALSAERKAVLAAMALNVNSAVSELWASLNTDVQPVLDKAKLPRTKKACEGLVQALRALVAGLVEEQETKAANARLETDKLRAELAELQGKARLPSAEKNRVAKLPGLISDSVKASDDANATAEGLAAGLARYPLAIAMAYFWNQPLPVTDSGRNIKGLAGFDESVPEAKRAEEYAKAKAGAKVGAAAKGKNAEDTAKQIKNIASASNKLVQARALVAAGIEGLRSEGFVDLAADLVDVMIQYIPSFSTAERAGADTSEALERLVKECEALQAKQKEPADKAML